jgi:hypothetical protein
LHCIELLLLLKLPLPLKFPQPRKFPFPLYVQLVLTEPSNLYGCGL